MIRPRRSTAVRASQTDYGAWIPFALILLFLLYWLFAWYLERIDLGPGLNQWWQTIAPVPLPGFVVFFVEMIHPRVLRHLIPAILGWLLARRAAEGLLQGLYDLPDHEVAAALLGRLRTPGVSGLPVEINAATLATQREQSVLLRVGGPGLIRINSGDVVVTELNGRFHRVLPPGIHALDRFEYILDVVDLREQKRFINDIHLATKEGIKMTADVSLTYRIHTGGEPPTKTNPYPYSAQAVRNAAYAATVTPDNQVSTWQNLPVSVASGRLNQIIGRYRLDEILYPASPASEPFLTIQNELERQVRAALHDVGIDLTSIHIERLETPEPVTNQYIEYWQAYWEGQRELSRANGAALALEEMEIARAEAEVTMIQAIVEGVQRARREGGAGTMREVVSLRLIEALERMARQSQELHPLPARLLPKLNELQRRLGPGTSGEDNSAAHPSGGSVE